MTAIDTGEILEALNDKMDRDVGNPADLGKERIVVMGIPDYSNGTSGTTTLFTAQSAGLISIPKLYIDKQFLIDAGDEVRLSDNSEFDYVFFPLKGVSGIGS